MADETESALSKATRDVFSEIHYHALAGGTASLAASFVKKKVSESLVAVLLSIVVLSGSFGVRLWVVYRKHQRVARARADRQAVIRYHTHNF